MIFTILLIIILICALIYMYYTYENAIYNLKNQLTLSNSQNLKLKSTLLENTDNFSNLTINFSNPEFSHAIINQKCYIYLCPLENSPIINILEQGIEINLLAIAEVQDLTWYEISLKIESNNINSRGWILEECINKLNLNT
ncbi:hypothetical protein [Hathewaya limosa]|uniref:Cbb3-type cytochrome oxidase subunit 3 n=1 Tax=Hathewaya limosa TaxID=1536 RepID=A0ABU0JQ93_HATLI|nr:hypothetical protein [Hathewaya limosa]AWZ49612.1 hypothetical protein C3495_12760 [Clostridiaceae bacterium 14S0207]MDQ0478600.1 cbb3-type cytochrome oxidase subunit 3 [Hathewaya limosa]